LKSRENLGIEFDFFFFFFSHKCIRHWVKMLPVLSLAGSSYSMVGDGSNSHSCSRLCCNSIRLGEVTSAALPLHPPEQETKIVKAPSLTLKKK
jgi:hypothetical protein